MSAAPCARLVSTHSEATSWTDPRPTLGRTYPRGNHVMTTRLPRPADIKLAPLYTNNFRRNQVRPYYMRFSIMTPKTVLPMLFLCAVLTDPPLQNWCAISSNRPESFHASLPTDPRRLLFASSRFLAQLCTFRDFWLLTSRELLQLPRGFWV